MKTKKHFWAGLSDGQLFCEAVDDGFGGFTGKPKVRHMCIYPTRKEARSRFDHVVKVAIHVGK